MKYIDHQHHPRNIVFHFCKRYLPSDLIYYISNYLSTIERLSNIPNDFEMSLISSLKECRNEETMVANSFTIYYDTIIPNIQNRTRLALWNSEYHTKEFIEYRNNNKCFSSEIGIINDDDIGHDDCMIDRFIYIRILFHHNYLIFINQRRRLRFMHLLKTFQNYGFTVDAESQSEFHCFSEYFYISKSLPLRFDELLQCNNITRQYYSINACITLLMDMHDDISSVFF